MKTLSKKILTVCLALMMAVVMAVPAFAATPAGNFFTLKNTTSGKMLNAATEASIINSNTNVTTYSASGHVTQKWGTVSLGDDRYIVATAATQYQNNLSGNKNLLYVLNILRSSNKCSLVRYGVLVASGDEADGTIRFVDEKDGQYGIVLPDYYAGARALTDSSSQAYWYGALKDNIGQLWKFNA